MRIFKKTDIIKDNKKKVGIYRWVNNINGKSYIGSSVDLSFRFSQYYNKSFLKKEVKRSFSKIYNSLLKHGHENFSLEILEYCTPNLEKEKLIQKIDLLKKEQHYFNKLNPEYNILPTAGSRLGYISSKETRAKMSITHKGIKHLEKTLLKLSIAKLGKNNPMYGKTLTDEMRAKLTAAKVHTFQKISVLDVKTGYTTIYESMTIAAKALNINKARISNYIIRKQKKPYKNQYVFSKIM